MFSRAPQKKGSSSRVIPISWGIIGNKIFHVKSHSLFQQTIKLHFACRVQGPGQNFPYQDLTTNPKC